MKTIREHNQEAEAARHQKKMAGVSCDYCKSQGVTSEMHFLVQDPLGLTYAMCENCGAVEKYDEYLVPTTK